jgi:hypothetical protein
MTTEHFLTEEDKISSLLALRESLVADIEKLLDELAIEKESFSISEYEPMANKKNQARYIPEQILYRHCQTANSIDEKIKELRNV